MSQGFNAPVVLAFTPASLHFITACFTPSLGGSWPKKKTKLQKQIGQQLLDWSKRSLDSKETQEIKAGDREVAIAQSSS